MLAPRLCGQCRARKGAYLCEGCKARQQAWLHAEADRCKATCATCEHRPVAGEGLSQCQPCIDSSVEDDGAKRSKLTREQLEGRADPNRSNLIDPTGWAKSPEAA